MIDLSSVTLTADQEARIAAILLERGPVTPGSNVLAHRKPTHLPESMRHAMRQVHEVRLKQIATAALKQLEKTRIPDGPGGGKVIAQAFRRYYDTDCKFEPEVYRCLCPSTFARMQMRGVK